MSILSGVKTLTGCIGSAFHNLMLSPCQPEKIIYLTNNEKDTNPNYALQDLVLHNESIYYACQDCLDRGKGNNKIRNPKRYLNFWRNILNEKITCYWRGRIYWFSYCR